MQRFPVDSMWLLCGLTLGVVSQGPALRLGRSRPVTVLPSSPSSLPGPVSSAVSLSQKVPFPLLYLQNPSV